MQGLSDRSIRAERALVVGLGVTGEAVARQLLARGVTVQIVDDDPSDEVRARATRLGLALVGAPDHQMLANLVASTDLVLPSPGVPAHHPVFALARANGCRVWSEFELAARWSQVPLVAITGTNGKTTVATLVAEMLAASGLRTLAAGNTDIPLVDAIDRDAQVIVVEASSFRLEFTETFRPHVAVWLNLAEDHLDWHPSMESYTQAKARIWACQRDDDVAIANADDAAVMAAARGAPARLVTFGMGEGADFHVEGTSAPGSTRARPRLVGPGGFDMDVAQMGRVFPHDLANALAAAAASLAAGAEPSACRAVLASFRGLPHRVTLVSNALGVRYYDDSKATTPASVLAAVRGFESVVLIAGGRNKDLDLGVLGQTVPPVHAVVAIGEASADIEHAFAGKVPVVAAASMDEAVAAAQELARAGDVVLLSPGCASFDRYGSYAQRGDDFARAVRRRIGA